MLKVSRLLATSLEILVANAKFSVALVTSWSQFRTLWCQFIDWLKFETRRSSLLNFRMAYLFENRLLTL